MTSGASSSRDHLADLPSASPSRALIVECPENLSLKETGYAAEKRNSSKDIGVGQAEVTDSHKKDCCVRKDCGERSQRCGPKNLYRGQKIVAVCGDFSWLEKEAHEEETRFSPIAEPAKKEAATTAPFHAEIDEPSGLRRRLPHDPINCGHQQIKRSR